MPFTASAVAAAVLGCVSITPASTPILHRASRPAIDAVSVAGLTFRDEQMTKRTEGSAVAYGSSAARANVGGIRGSATGSSIGTAAASSRSYESFENRELQRGLRLALEESGIARRVIADAPFRVEGLFQGEADTGAGRIIFNVFNSIPLFGTLPYLGSTRATVQLRLYHEDELLGTWIGTGRSNWSKSLFFTPGLELSSTLAEVRNQSILLATQLAVQDAVARMAGDTNQIAAVVEERTHQQADASRNTHPGQAHGKGATSLCDRRWPANPIQRDHCQTQQHNAFTRLSPAISRLKVSPTAVESQVLRGCYATGQSAGAADWEMIESCYVEHPVPPAASSR
jgi:hypothetical protein